MGYRTILKQCARPWRPPMNCDGLKFRPNFVANPRLRDATTMIDVGCFYLATDLQTFQPVRPPSRRTWVQVWFSVHTGTCGSTVIEFYDLLSVCCFRPPSLGSSYPPCDSNTPRSARVPHRSGSLRQSRASAAPAKPEPSADLGSARANRHR
jgi:hypothetical protein